MSEAVEVVAIMAHPDDVELLCGGALLKCADRGVRTGAIDLTRGERGTRGTPEIRRKEAEDAAGILGLAERRNAGLVDAGIRNDAPSRQAVAGLIRELRPRVVVTHATRGRHPDHRRAAELVYDAAFLAGLENYDAPGARHRPEKVVYATAFREDPDPPTFVVDISEQMERKLKAVAAYASQFEGVVRAGEVFPGGERPLHDQIRAWCAACGSRVRTAYGEPYRTVETIEATSLETLPVATF